MSVYSLELPGLKTRYLGRPCFHFTTVDSTLDILRNLNSQRASEGTTVLADHQSSGRGRQGRPWISLPGNQIFVSMLLRPKLGLHHFALINIVTGLAICEALEQYDIKDVMLKWPNDVFVLERKIAGILSELHQESGTSTLYLGWGVNVDGTMSSLPEEIKSTASTVEMFKPSPDRFEILSLILNQLEIRIDDLCSGLDSEITNIQKDFQKRWIYRGRKISIDTGEKAFTGTSDSIDRDGALLIKLEDGKTVRVLSGDVAKLRFDTVHEQTANV